MSSRQLRNNNDNNDQNVLTIFLPLLAVALLGCAGACCYMERRRKKKLKKGAEAIQEEQLQFNDAASIISSASRRRSYMLPTVSSGSLYRSASRTGSIRSNFDFKSTYGEPPPYSGKTSRRNSLASIKALEEENERKLRGVFNEGFDGSRRSLRRSRSMLDLNNEFDSAPLRRTRSFNNNRRNSHQVDRFLPEPPLPRYDYDDSQSQQSARGYAGNQAQRSIHHENAGRKSGYIYDRPTSVASNPVGRRSSMKRSFSQPNLRNQLTKTGTYPMGILKQNGIALEDDNGFQRAPSSITGGSRRGPTQMREGSRPQSRLKSSGFGPGLKGYNTYSSKSPLNYPTNADASSFGPPPIGPGRYNQPQVGLGGASNWSSPQLSQNFDPYNLSESYLEFEGASQAGSVKSPYNLYGSMIY